MIETDIRTALLETCERVYFLNMPQDVEVPAIRFSIIYQGEKQALSGDICETDHRIQVDIFAKRSTEARTIRDAAVLQIVALKGVEISSHPDYEPDTKLYKQIIDFKTRRR